MERLTIAANGLEFRAVAAGPENGPLVLCLHGFPDHERSFRFQLPALATAGYRAVAPCLRGYHPGAIPKDGRYHVAFLAEDTLAILDALGAKKAALIGHDWGGEAVYAAAILAPERVPALVAIADPHPSTELGRADFSQMKRYWYMYFFQLPEALEAVRRDDFAFIDKLWLDWSPSYRLEEGERRALKQTLSEPGVLEATLQYYRDLYDSPDAHSAAKRTIEILGRPVPVPSLYIHGAEDGCIGIDLAQAMGKGFANRLRKCVIPKAGHFVHLEKPEAVNRAILDFLTETEFRISR